jgi:hypothetical protein
MEVFLKVGSCGKPIYKTDESKGTPEKGGQ